MSRTAAGQSRYSSKKNSFDKIKLKTILNLKISLCFSYRPTRCPSLTCGEWPAAALLSEHIASEHDGTVRGKDVVVRTGSNRLVSSYVNVDREPIFYKDTKTSWVANELILGR